MQYRSPLSDGNTEQLLLTPESGKAHVSRYRGKCSSRHVCEAIGQTPLQDFFFPVVALLTELYLKNHRHFQFPHCKSSDLPQTGETQFLYKTSNGDAAPHESIRLNAMAQLHILVLIGSESCTLSQHSMKLGWIHLPQNIKRVKHNCFRSTLLPFFLTVLLW